MAHVAPKGHELVLDVATGTGHNALSFAPHVRQVIGLDLTAAMLAEACGLAQQRAMSNVCFFQGDSECLPFANNSFDVVTCRVAPHHFPDVASAMREMARVCHAEGCIAIVDNITPEDAEACAYINAWETLRDPHITGPILCRNGGSFFSKPGWYWPMKKSPPSPCTLSPGPRVWASARRLSPRSVASYLTLHPYRGSVCAHASKARKRISTSPKSSSSPAKRKPSRFLHPLPRERVGVRGFTTARASCRHCRP